MSHTAQHGCCPAWHGTAPLGTCTLASTSTPGQAVHPAPHHKLSRGLSHEGSPQPDQWHKSLVRPWPCPFMGWPNTQPLWTPTPHTPLQQQQGLQKPPRARAVPELARSNPFGFAPSEGRVAVDVGGLEVVGRPAVMPHSGILRQLDPRRLKGHPIATMGPCRARTCWRAAKARRPRAGGTVLTRGQGRGAR